MSPKDPRLDASSHRDPMTGTPGAHPVGTGIGAALGGALAGAAAATVVGPVGTVIGAAVGAVAGGLAGKGIAETIDPTVEDAYWRENYKERPYAGGTTSYDDYGPAYRFGVEAYRRDPGRSFDEAEAGLAQQWNTARTTSALDWARARNATRDAWERVSNAAERDTASAPERDAK